jgi:hypothetical protein
MSSVTFSSVVSGAAAWILGAEDRAALPGTPLPDPVRVKGFGNELEVLLLLLLLLLLLMLTLVAVVVMRSDAQNSASMPSKSSSAFWTLLFLAFFGILCWKMVF